MDIPSALLISALCLVESGNNAQASTRDRHNRLHLGVLQIEARVVADVNEYLQKHRTRGIPVEKFLHRDCLNRQKAIRIFGIYCERYGVTDDRDAALLLRFGPTGRRQHENDNLGSAYWLQVSSTMEDLNARHAIETMQEGR